MCRRTCPDCNRTLFDYFCEIIKRKIFYCFECDDNKDLK